MFDDPKPRLSALAAPRGNAKSTLVSLALPLWCALFRRKHYIVIVSDTASQADDFLNNIKNELETNERIISDFGNQIGTVWTNSDIILANGVVRIQSLGTGKRIRGRRFRQWRPDLIICDDLENDENIRSPEQRQKDEQWFKRALSKAGDERTDMMVIGTLLHYDSLLAKLLKNPVYQSAKYKSVIKWSNSPKWDKWEKIIYTLDNPNRIADAYAFFEANKEEMLAGTEVLWPEKEDYYSLMLQRVADGPAAFASEKQNEPLSDDERRFLPEWIQYYDDSDLVGKDLYVVGYCDPSLGKQGGDYSAVITLASDYNYNIYVLDADISKRHPDIIIDTVIEKHLTYRYVDFGVEEVQFQEYFKDTLVNKSQERGVQVPVRGVKQRSDKILRIQSLQPAIKSGRVKFRRSQQDLIEQLVNFPSAAHDDGPDALEGAMTMIASRSGYSDYLKDLVHGQRQSPAGSAQQILSAFGIRTPSTPTG